MTKLFTLGTPGAPGVSKETEDRQRALNDVCRRVLDDFVGRKITSTVVAEAEGAMRSAINDAVRAGKYVLPDGLVVDRVELGENMRLQVFFKRSSPESLFPNLYGQKTDELEDDTDDTYEDLLGCPDPETRTMKDRFDAVAAEISNHEEEEP